MIGVVGDDGSGELADRLGDAQRSVHVGTAEEIVNGDPTIVVAVGEGALADLVRADVDAPVLPIGTRAGLPSVPPDDVSAVVDGFLTGGSGTRDLQLLSVMVGGDAVRPAVFDAMLVRAEPGRISEFGLAAGGTSSRFRADGVVVATPAGSHGYANAAGGPRLGPDASAVAVVPVAPFGLGAPTWVFDADEGVRLSVERDEGDVSLLIDGHERRRLVDRTAVDLRAGGTIQVVDYSDR